MSGTVSVSGGGNNPPAVLRYTANDQAFMQAQALASNIGSTYPTAIYYNPNQQPVSPGYLIIQADFAGNAINASGFGAVVDENNTTMSAIMGGGSATGQTVLAGSGGLIYTAYTGNNTVVAGGGNNSISFSGSSGNNVATTSTGNDTITAGTGNTTISAGTGNNYEYLQSGTAVVNVTGQDTVTLGATGSDTINVMGSGSALVLGPTSGAGASLVFIGGTLASTVEGGVGSYSIAGGAGGGVFDGGANGNNSIVGGTGNVTINGGGAGDTLQGGAGNDSISASFGNETLGGGAGTNTFDLTIHEHAGNAGDTTTDQVTDFSTMDLLNVGGTTAVNQALSTYQVVGGSGSFLLQDGTKVVLDGYTKPLTSGNFS